MARSVDTINASIVAQIQSSGIVDTTTWSKRNIVRLLCYIFATCAAYIEQMMDALQANLEVTASQTPAASRLWIQAKMFQFQYSSSSTTPQIIQLTNLIPQYPIVDPTLQIIKACSVDSVVPNEVIIKVAKLYSDNVTLIALTTDEANAAQSYINTVGDAGVQYQLISQAPDLIYIAANIYFTGQYSTISANVITALTNFLQNLSLTNFDGAIKVSDLEGIIKGVTGVNDVTLIKVIIRPSTVAFSLTPTNQAQILVNPTISDSTKSAVINRQWKTIAGYCTGEPIGSGYDLASTLNFIAE